MGLRGVAVLALVSGLLVLPCAAPADVIELTSGERVEGTIKEMTSEQIILEVGGQEIRFPHEKVRAFQAGQTVVPAASPPEHGLASEAIAALTGLQSVTRGGVIYRDYVGRVGDAKIRVDRYLIEFSLDNGYITPMATIARIRRCRTTGGLVTHAAA